MSTGTLVVGGGQAATQLALSLRELGDTAPITIVGAEEHAPYQRPPLSKAFLKADADPASLALRADAFYERARVNVVRSTRVDGISLHADGSSGTAHSANGFEVPFERLALTTGARVRRLNVPGAQLAGVCYLRDVNDAQHLKRQLSMSDHVVIVGGGFIGLEAAAVAREQAKHVTVVEGANRLVPRAVAPVVSTFLLQAHERRGTNILLESSVVGIDESLGHVTGVTLSNGSVLRADLVVVGIGIEPRTELAEQLGLRCDRGIVVDAYARTSNPAITAAGDCTIMPNPAGGDAMVRLESVQNAVDQAKCAAASLIGMPRPYDAVPWFWSDQADLKLQIAGLSWGFDEHVVRGDPDSERFSVLYYREGALIGVDAINCPQDYMAVRRALSSKQSIPRDQAGRVDVPLKQMVGER